MGNCKDCRYWTPPGYVTDYAKAGYDQPLGCCELTRVDNGELHPLVSKAVAADGNGSWNCVLTTAPDFGCVQFEDRGVTA